VIVEETYSLEEAQKASVTGVAVFGNPAMQDVVWAAGSPTPFMWITNGYVAMNNPGEMHMRDGWRPLHPRRKT